MFILSPLLIDSRMPPESVRVRIAEGVEALRLCAELFARMMQDEFGEYADGDLRADRAGCVLYSEVLQELIGDSIPVIDRALATLRVYENRWPRSDAWAEAVALTGHLAVRCLDAAIEEAGAAGEDFEVLIDLLHGAVRVASSVANYSGDLPGLGFEPDKLDKVLGAVLAGDEASLPPFKTEGDVEALYASYRRS